MQQKHGKPSHHLNGNRKTKCSETQQHYNLQNQKHGCLFTINMISTGRLNWPLHLNILTQPTEVLSLCFMSFSSTILSRFKVLLTSIHPMDWWVKPFSVKNLSHIICFRYMSKKENTQPKNCIHMSLGYNRPVIR